MRSFIGVGLAVVLWLVAETGYAQVASYRVVATYGDTRDVTCLQVQGDTLWAGTLGGGVVRVRGTQRARFGAAHGLPAERVRDCVWFGAALWVATDSGLARFDDHTQRFARVEPGRFLRLAASGTQLLAADARGRLLRFTALGKESLARMDFTPNALAAGEDGTSWAAGGLDGRVVCNGARVVLPKAGVADAHVEPIEALRFEGAALFIDTTDRHFRDHAGSSSRVAALQERVAIPAGLRVSARGTWNRERVIATDRGLYALAPADSAWRAIDVGDAFPCGDRISSLAVHRGALFIGSFDRGLCRFDGKRFVHLGGPSVLPSEMVNDLASDGERLYVATARGLSVMQPDGTFRLHTHDACVSNLRNACPWYLAVNGVAVDAKTRDAWVADFGSVHRIASTQPEWEHIDGGRVGSRALTRIAVRDGRIAVGSGDRGVLFASLARLTERSRFTRIDHQAGLADDWVMDLAFDAQGALWVATCTRGVSVRSADGKLRTLTSDDGLADDYTLSVNEVDGQMWIGTLRGVSLVRGSKIESFREGLSGDEVHDVAAFGGQVWLATDGGLSVLQAVSGDDGASLARYAR